MSTVPIDHVVYPERRFGGFSRRDGTLQFCNRVQALLEPGQMVLDVGCGRGKRQDDRCAFRRQMQDFRGDDRTVIGIDVDDDAATNPYLTEFRKIEDVDHWPVDDASVDLIYNDFVLEHVADPQQFFSECWRVLKPGGYVCMRTPNRRGYVALIATVVPNSMHQKIVAGAQVHTKTEDVFPTVYRANTRGRLRRLLRQRGFDCVVYRIEAEPS